jgi:D-lactate dehydrogenase (cytochrome)
MKKVVRLNVDDMDVVVEPGISYGELNEYLKPYNLFFPVDPGPGASIGGMVQQIYPILNKENNPMISYFEQIGTSCSGTNAVRYGTMKVLF